MQTYVPFHCLLGWEISVFVEDIGVSPHVRQKLPKYIWPYISNNFKRFIACSKIIFWFGCYLFRLLLTSSIFSTKILFDTSLTSFYAVGLSDDQMWSKMSKILIEGSKSILGGCLIPFRLVLMSTFNQFLTPTWALSG